MRFRALCRCLRHALLSAVVKGGRILLPFIFVLVALPVFWLVLSRFGPDMFWGIIGAGMIAFFFILGLHHAGRVQLADQYSSLSRALLLVRSRLNRLKTDPDPLLLNVSPSVPTHSPTHPLTHSPQVSWEQTLGHHSDDDEPYEDDIDLSENVELVDDCLVDTTTGEIVSFPAAENIETPEPFETFNRSHDQRLQEYLHPEDYELEPDPYYFYQTECEDQLDLPLPDPKHIKPIAVVYIP